MSFPAFADIRLEIKKLITNSLFVQIKMARSLDDKLIKFALPLAAGIACMAQQGSSEGALTCS